jgi:ketosteroid isomerase-like protein
MKQSSEIKQLMTRFYEEASKGNFDVVDGFVSQDDVRWIGTDPNEWWETPAAVSKAWRDQTAAVGTPLRITAGDFVAYQQDNVAWLSDRPVFHMADATTVPFRLTAVWLREPDGWKIVQFHASVGVPNEKLAEEHAAAGGQHVPA